MTIAEFLKHLQTQKCQYNPLEGANIPGIAIKISNPAMKKVHYLNVYKGGNLSDQTIIAACNNLFIKYPKHLEHLAKGPIE